MKIELINAKRYFSNGHFLGGIMVNQTIRKISVDIEILMKSKISVERALDLLEASTCDIEEIVAINTMRESLGETKESKPETTQQTEFPFSAQMPLFQQPEPLFLYA